MALAARIIPCLDVQQGRVVKGTNFVNLRDAGDPVEIAGRYNQEGADELCFLDIAASHEQRRATHSMIREVARQLFIPMTVGGGVNSLKDIEALLHCGADKVSINSGAIQQPDLIRQAARHFGSQCIVIAIDAKTTAANQWRIFTHGGRYATDIDAVDWAKRMSADGAGEVLLTAMDNDGTKQGFNLPLTKAISDAVSVPVVASGGVGNLQHLADGILHGGAQAVLAASIFHYGEYRISEAKDYLSSQGILMRQ